MQIPKDLTRVDPNNLSELIWWCNHLAISPERLLSITDKKGMSVKEIRVYLCLHPNLK